jgi:hypothetical protein
MNIEHDLLNLGLVDADGERCGRVDDVLVEDGFDRPARVTAILSGNGAMSRLIGRRALRVSVFLHRLLGLEPPIEPVEVPWGQVRRVGHDVRLRSRAGDLKLEQLNWAVARRFIGRIPGAGR